MPERVPHTRLSTRAWDFDRCGAGMTQRSNSEWLAALKGADEDRAAALVDLRSYLLRAALFTLRRARHHVGHLDSSGLGALAEDCAQEALAAIMQHLDDFRGIASSPHGHMPSP